MAKLPVTPLTCLEICAGTGGQALGLAMAGFHHVALVEIDEHACSTLRLNRPEWNSIREDVRTFNATPYSGIDLLAGGVPCPPFSVAGNQLGADDERDLFPAALDLVEQTRPRAVMIENVAGLMQPKFQAYRAQIQRRLRSMGYGDPQWDVVNASDFGVPQLRPRSVLVAFSEEAAKSLFTWPKRTADPVTVGQALRSLIGAGGWKGAEAWAAKANRVAPTLVGGSKKHGGPDLGPTRAKLCWQELGIDGHGLADRPPPANFPVNGRPKITVEMAAAVQGFPPSWTFSGKKTAAYRQVGNAFPPPVAKAFGQAISMALRGEGEAGLSLDSIRRMSA